MPAFYVTTPIYYVNDVPHLGHAYTTIIADILARYHRAVGDDVFFLTGTDEHGQKIEDAATANKETPIALADRVVARFRKTWENFNISCDDFIRTTEPRHSAVVHAIWRRMAASGDIYLGEYDGLYCVGCEQYYTESELDGSDTCPVHGTKVQKLKQPSYFFRMSRYQDQLIAHIEAHPDFIQPDMRQNEILSFVRSGLRDLSISRTTFTWGIPVPDDPKHVIYVWIDALTNYISALGGFEEHLARFRTYWPANLHLMGKDILRFHAVYWPTMLMSAGLPLPQRIVAHGWWTINGQKMSKSLRNVVEPNMVAADVGRDALRYFLARETHLGSDGDFSHDGLFHRINAELANDLGNLLNRSVAMARKYCEARMPAFADELERDPLDQALIELGRRARDAAAKHYEAALPSRALEAIWELVRGANKYIDAAGPYKLIKDPANRRRVDEVVANFLEALRWISLLVSPVMPDKAVEIRTQLGLGQADAANQVCGWPAVWGELPPGLEIPGGDALFPRIDDDRKAELIQTWSAAAGPAPASAASQPASTPQGKSKMTTTTASNPADSAAAAPADGPVKIAYDDFAKLDLRVAKVLTAERVEGADRLLKVSVDLGSETRQVVAGIAEAYAPEELVGRSVIFLANLKPAKIRGVQSDGMILAAGGKKVVALSALDRDVAPGTKVS